MKRFGWIACFALPTLLAGAEAPRSRLQEEIDAAPAGALLHVVAGVHDGPLILSKPLRLIGEKGAVIDGGGRGHGIEIRAPDVEVRGVLVRNSGKNLGTDDAGILVTAPRARLHDNVVVDTLHGIYLRGAEACHISRNVIRGRAAAEIVADPVAQGFKLSPAELCSEEIQQDQRGNGIHVWNCSRHVIEENDIRGTRDGVYFQFCNDSRVLRNVIREARYGLHYMYSHRNRFEENVFEENAAGAAIMYSNDIVLLRNRFSANRGHRAYGLLMHTVERTRIEENEIVGNTVGAFLENSVANAFLRNRVASNYIGIRLSDSSDDNRFGGNRFRGNVHPVEASGLNPTNAFSVDGVGNYWEDAVRLDLDRNGIADVPHRETDLFGRWRRSFPQIGLLSGSPGERAIRFVHSRVRLPGVPGVLDAHPLAADSR